MFKKIIKKIYTTLALIIDKTSICDFLVTKGRKKSQRFPFPKHCMRVKSLDIAEKFIFVNALCIFLFLYNF